MSGVNPDIEPGNSDRDGKRRKRVALLAWLFALGIPTVVGYALWSASGVGDGTAKAITASGLTVSPGTAVADLYPGQTAGALAFTISNPNPYPVSVASATFGTVTSGDPVNCPASNVTTSPATSLSIALAAGAVDEPVTVPAAVSVDIDAPDGCQGVTFTIATTVTASQTS